MKGLLLAGLLSGAAQIHAHPHTNAGSSHKPGSLNRRTVDLNAFRLISTTDYINSTETASNSTIANSLFKRDSYVDTATDLVKATFPTLTFRVVGDNYVGANGVGHVNFKQTIHDLDIDNADFNVNVGTSEDVGGLSAHSSYRSAKTERSSHLETLSTPETSRLSVR